MSVRTPVFSSIVINSQNVTNQLAPDIIEYTYDSVLQGGASSIEFTIRNVNRNVLNPPQLGQFIEVKHRYSGDANEMNSGTLRIDFMERSSDPTIIRYGATAFDYNLGLSNFSVQTYSNRTLSSIIQEIATSANLTLLGEPSGDIVGTATTQSGIRSVSVNGNRLRLLQDLADTYGYAMNLRLGFLIFRDWTTLESQFPNFQINLGDVTRYRIRERASGLYRTALALYSDTASVSIVDNTVPQDINFDVRGEGFYANIGSATRRSIGQLAKTNRGRFIIYADLFGEYLYAGDIVNLIGAGSDNGKYICMRSTHNFAPDSGWTMQIELFKIFGSAATVNTTFPPPS
jgi:hypothetical protein